MRGGDHDAVSRETSGSRSMPLAAAVVLKGNSRAPVAVSYHCVGSIGRIVAAISGYGMSGASPKSGSPPPRRSTSDTRNAATDPAMFARLEECEG